MVSMLFVSVELESCIYLVESDVQMKAGGHSFATILLPVLNDSEYIQLPGRGS